jgi:quinolinate synthase
MIDLLKEKELNLSNEELISEINSLRKKRNAIILAHYYQEAEIQDIADFIGDSLQLSRQAAKTEADVIVFAGVHFMAETAKILSPAKTVLLPDLEAGCSLADSCKAEDFQRFLKAYPGHTVISYVNTTAEIKALTDIICTSSNALAIVNSLPKDEKIVFAPDKNLGSYIAGVTGRDMVIWNGACHVHERFSLVKILQLKNDFPKAKIIAHPECEKPILIISDFIGSTAALLKYTESDNSSEYIVCTESGILHQMRKMNTGKKFIPAPPSDSSCACNDCQFMKMITLKKIYLSLKNNQFEITLNEEIRKKAERPIRRMLELSQQLGF